MSNVTAESPAVGATGRSSYSLSHHGLQPAKRVYWNLSPTRLYEEAFAQGDGPRTHSKGMLTKTNVFSLTFIDASGNTNPVDPARVKALMACTR